jgi:hypothetical protein
MKSSLSAVAVVLGLLLLIASFAWGVLFPANRAWTEEKSARMADIGGEAGKLKAAIKLAQARPSMHAGQNPAEMQAKYEKLSAEYKSLHDEFTGAVDTPKTASKILRWSGIAFVIAGAIIVFANRG